MNALPPLRAAVIGCGKIGAEELLYPKALRPATHAALFSEQKRITVLALVDSSKSQLEKAKRLFPRAFLFRSVQRMMKEIQPDIVSVAVPTPMHEKIIGEVVFYHPLAVICEKPLALQMKAAERIVDLCRKRRIMLFVNHTRRFDPELLKVRREIKKIGPIVQGTAYYTRGLFNNGTHLVDLLRFCLGEVESVFGLRNRRTEHWKDLKNDLNIDGMLLFKSGSRVALQSFDANDYSIFDIVLYGRKGSIPLTKRVKGSMKGLGIHVIDCLDGKAKPMSTGEDGLEALEILFALKKSAELQGRAVKVI